MKYLTSLAMISLVLGCAGCVSTFDNVVVGKTRDPISPDSVRVYYAPPAKYEVVSNLDITTVNPWATTDDAMRERVLSRLKSAAAKLGANGLLLSGGDKTLQSTASSAAQRSVNNTENFFAEPVKTVKTMGQAIWVKQG